MNPAPVRGMILAHVQGVAFRSAQCRRVIGERVLRLGDDHRHGVPAVVLDVLQVLQRTLGVLDILSAVNFLRDGLDGGFNTFRRIIKLLGLAIETIQ